MGLKILLLEVGFFKYVIQGIGHGIGIWGQSLRSVECKINVLLNTLDLVHSSLSRNTQEIVTSNNPLKISPPFF